MTDEDYKKFSDYISTERNNYNKKKYSFERAMQNIFSKFEEICYAESKSWALMILGIAKDTDIDELMKICYMQIAFDKPRAKW